MWVDFQRYDAGGNLPLDCIGSIESIEGQGLKLADGMAVGLFEDEADLEGYPGFLVTEGVVRWDATDERWTVVVDRETIRWVKDAGPGAAWREAEQRLAAFVAGPDRGMGAAALLERALEAALPDGKHAQDLVTALACYRPEGGMHLYGVEEMVRLLRTTLPALRREAAMLVPGAFPIRAKVWHPVDEVRWLEIATADGGFYLFQHEDPTGPAKWDAFSSDPDQPEDFIAEAERRWGVERRAWRAVAQAPPLASL